MGIILLSVLFPMPVSAHPLSVSYSTLIYTGNELELSYSIDLYSITESTDLGLIDEEKFRISQAQISEWISTNILIKVNNEQLSGVLKEITMEDKQSTTMATAIYTYPVKKGDNISLEDMLYKEDGAYYTNFLVYHEGEIAREAILKGDHRQWETIAGGTTEAGGSAGRNSAWSDFLLLGMEHILTGYDHLLFLLALLLGKQSFKQYAATITAFTIAHSITLSLAVLGIVTIPSKWVELTIALSICYVAVENIVRKEISHRALITFLFGLVHGLGFAGILSEMDIPTTNLALSLISFNVGIEIVQIVLVLLLLPLLGLLQRSSWQRMSLTVCSTAIVAIGAFWSIERLFS